MLFLIDCRPTAVQGIRRVRHSRDRRRYEEAIRHTRLPNNSGRKEKVWKNRKMRPLSNASARVDNFAETLKYGIAPLSKEGRNKQGTEGTTSSPQHYRYPARVRGTTAVRAKGPAALQNQ